MYEFVYVVCKVIWCLWVLLVLLECIDFVLGDVDVMLCWLGDGFFGLCDVYVVVEMVVLFVVCVFIVLWLYVIGCL